MIRYESQYVALNAIRWGEGIFSPFRQDFRSLRGDASSGSSQPISLCSSASSSSCLASLPPLLSFSLSPRCCEGWWPYVWQQDKSTRPPLPKSSVRRVCIANGIAGICSLAAHSFCDRRSDLVKLPLSQIILDAFVCGVFFTASLRQARRAE